MAGEYERRAAACAAGAARKAALAIEDGNYQKAREHLLEARRRADDAIKLRRERK